MKKNTLSSISIDENIKGKAQDVIFKIAEKLKDPYHIKKASIRENGTSTFFPLTLSHGYPGTIILFAELDRQFPNQNWDYIAHEHLQALEKELHEIPIYSYSLFTGLTGIAFATYIASRNRTRYAKFLEQIESLLHKNISNIIEQSLDKWLKEKSAKASMFDVVGGVSGIGRYMLLANNDTNCHYKSLLKINEFLVKITKSINVNNFTIPGWYVSSRNLGSQLQQEMFPQGNINYGLSHGISGPLAILSLSLKHGIEVEGQKETIKYLIDWLYQLEDKDIYGPCWTGRISFEDYITKKFIKGQSSKESWCYGNPGILRAIYLAGDALKNEKIMKKCIDDFKIIYSRPENKWGLDSPTFCHGLAGLLQITLCMEDNLMKSLFTNKINFLAQKLIEQYDADSVFGYKDTEPHNGQNVPIDKVGLLEGSAGIALSLLSLIKTTDTLWDSMFLIK